MPIFSKSLPKQLADATAATAKLTQRLADAEIAVTDNRKAAEGLALAGADDAKLDEAEAKTRASVDRVATLKAALAQAEVAVAGLERERDEAADRALREKTSTETEALARRVTEGCAKLVADAVALSDWTARAAAVVPESGGVLNFCQIISREIPQASELIAKLLRVHAASVIAGHAASSLPQPMEPYVPPPVEKPALVQVFTLHAIQFVDHEGTVRQVGKWRDVGMVPALAEKAIRLRLCAPMSDPRRQKLVGQSPGHPEPAWLNDIDKGVGPDIAQKPIDPIMASTPQFTVIDRGPAIPMKVATRSLT